MHELTERTVSERIATRYAHDHVLPWLLLEMERASSLPVIADGFGHNRSSFDALLHEEIPALIVPVFLMWVSGGRDPDVYTDWELFGELVDAYTAGADESGLIERLAPLGYGYLEDCDYWHATFEPYDGAPSGVAAHLLTELTLHDSSDVLELIDRLDGTAFDLFVHAFRLTFLETNYRSLDPYEREIAGFFRDTFTGHLDEGERKLVKDGMDPADLAADGWVRYTNPYKGGGFTCIT